MELQFFKKKYRLLLIIIIVLFTATQLYTEEKEKNHPKYHLYIKHLNTCSNMDNEGKYRNAISEGEKALGLSIEIFGNESPKTLMIFKRLGSISQKARIYNSAISYYKKALEIRLKRPGKENSDIAEINNSLGIAYFSLGDFKSSMNCYNKSLPIYLKKFGKDHYSVGISYINIGRAHESLGKNDTAIDFYNRSLNIFLKYPDKYKSYTAIIYNYLAESYKSKGGYDDAITYYNKALKIQIEIHGLDNPDTASSYGGIGMSLYLKGEYSLAINYLNKALKIYREKLGDNHPSTGIALSHIGEVLRALGKIDRALDYLNRAQNIYLKNFGSNNLYTASVYINLGEIYRAKGEYERAIEYHEKGINIYIKMLGKDHTYIGTCHNYLGGVYKSMDDYDRAISNYKKGLKIYLKNLDADHQYVATTYINLGGAYEPRGNYQTAAEYYEKALKIYSKRLGDSHPFTATALNNLGLVYYASGNYERAIYYIKRAKKIYLKKLGENHPHSANADINLGLAYKKKGEHDNSVKYFKSAIAILKKSSDRYRYITAMASLAQVYLEKKSSSKASKILWDAVSTILKYRIEIGRGKSGFTSRYIFIFNRLISLELQLGHFEKAFIADSMKRGLSITEDMCLKDALVRGKVAKEKQKTVLSHINSIEELQAKRSVYINSGKIKQADKILEDIWTIERKKNIFNKKLLNEYPEYSSLVNPKFPSVKDIKSALKKGQALISYSFIDDQLLAFIITGEKGLEVINTSEITKKAGNSIITDIKNLYTLLKFPVSRSEYKLIKTIGGQQIIWNIKADEDLYSVKDNDVYALIRKRQGDLDALAKNINDRYLETKIGSICGKMRRNEALKQRSILCHRIYELAMKRVIAKIGNPEKLIIIPDGILYYLPFGLLRDKLGNMLSATRQYKLAHSASVWYMLHKSSRRPSKYPLLAVGNAVYNQGHKNESTHAVRGMNRSSGIKGLKITRDTKSVVKNINSLRSEGLKNLPGTEHEINAITMLTYRDKNERKRHILSGVKASEDMIFFLKKSGRLKDYRIIHFAAHGLFVDRIPSLNSIILSQPDIVNKYKSAEYKKYVAEFGAYKRDGFLRLGEVKTLELNSDLVVMSACETSMGHNIDGEGMIGLPQAFLIAGSRAVVASLWPVDDEAACFLMEEFYKNVIEKKMKPGEALRKAQLSLQEEFPDPFFWAAFVIYGR